MEESSIKLLKECNSGIKTAVKSMEEVLDNISDKNMLNTILNNKKIHEELGDETHVLLNKYGDDEKDPAKMADVMSWLKINMKLLNDSSDSVIADLMIDGCNMGIKSVKKYMNKYRDADKEARSIADKIIKLEHELLLEMMEII